MGELLVLGSCGAWPEPGRACSGYLLEHNGFRVLLDLGYGTAAPLLAACPDGAVDAVIVTHAHPDHCGDLTALGRVRHYRAAGRPPLPLYSPPEVVDVLRAMEPRPDPATVFDLRDLASATRVGPFALSSLLLPHYVPNLGVRLSVPGLTVAYTGDSGPSPELADLGAEADLFVMDATLQGPPPRAEPRYVMTAGEAAGWAARAGARRLLLTHFWPGLDRARSAREAAAEFDGEVLVADEGLRIQL